MVSVALDVIMEIEGMHASPDGHVNPGHSELPP
jgi:hypothetical protein